MPDISLLADKTAAQRRANNLRVPDAARRVLRAEGMGNRADFNELVSDICSELQKRAVARRKKNKRSGRRSPVVPEQVELKFDETHVDEALAMIAERGGDPED